MTLVEDLHTDAPAPADAPTAAALTEVVTRLRRALRSSIRTQFPWESLPVAQVELMQSLAEASPARMSALADRLHLAPSTVSGLASQLIAGGLVERGTDPEDRRAAVVVLTPAGARTLVEWEAAHERRISSALSHLEVEQREAIQRAIPALSTLARLLAEPQSQPDDPAEQVGNGTDALEVRG